MAIKKVKKWVNKILQAAKDYELEKLQTGKDIRSATDKINKLTEDIRSTPTT